MTAIPLLVSVTRHYKLLQARIGVAVEVVGMDVLSGGQAGRSAVFTVRWG